MKSSYILLVFSLAHHFAQGNYEFQVRVYSYNHFNDRRDFEGRHCDVFSTNACENYFIFCLQAFGASQTSTICHYGFYNTISNPQTATFVSFPTGQNIFAQGINNPLVFSGSPGSPWIENFQFQVRVDDDDSPDSDDLIDRIFIVESGFPISDTFTPRRTYNGIFGNVRMELSYRAICKPNYYGPRCTVFCSGRDDSGGHYTCNGQGDRICLTGWTDLPNNCLTPICSPSCPTNSRCTAPGVCTCVSGWTGDNCAQCVPATGCEHGSCINPGECVCDPGYSGILCGIDEDVCGHQSPCQHGGTCSNNGPGDYTCACPSTFTGTDCESDVDECNTGPCLNGGTCTNTPGGYNCTCAMGWTGPDCNDNIDECATTPDICQNGGTCTDCVRTSPEDVVAPGSPQQSDCPLGYHCSCSEGYFGDNCETEVDYCDSSPCLHGGTCHDIINGPGYRCTCALGYTGNDCNSTIDYCSPNPCQHGGTCSGYFGGFNCSCAPGYTGSECETDIDDCASSPCNAQNTHECVDGVDSYVCVCLPGYTGQNCDTEIDECESAPCLNGGSCTDLLNDFECTCLSGFAGAVCDINIDDCHPDFCIHGGTCIDQVEGYTCSCLPQYTGRQCEDDVPPPCSSSPCPLGTFCEEDRNTYEFTCQDCQEGVEGCDIGVIVDPDAQQGKKSNNGPLIGGVVGGVVGALLLVCLIVALVIVCVRCCTCCPCVSMKDKEDDTYQTIDSGAQQNPLYLGTSTLLSSQSGTLRSASTTMPRYDGGSPTYTELSNVSNDPGLSPAAARQHANPMYDLAQVAIYNGTPPALPTRKPSVGRPVSPVHYERLPGDNLHAASKEVATSGKYDRLKPEPQPEVMSSGKYDRLSSPTAHTATDNHYVLDRGDGYKVLPPNPRPPESNSSKSSTNELTSVPLPSTKFNPYESS